MTQLMPLLDVPDVMSVRWSVFFFATIFVPIIYARALIVRFGMTVAQSYGSSVVGIVLLLNIFVATFVPYMLSLGLFLVAGGSGILLFADRDLPWRGPLLFLGVVIPIFCAILLIWMDGGSHWDQIHAYPLLPYNLAVFNTPSLAWSPQGGDGPLLSDWFLIEQAIAPTLDAVEILLTGQFSGYLNRLFGVGLFVLAFSLIWSLPRQTFVARLAITGMLIALILEQLFVFRPHMTVGLLVVMFWAVLMREFSAQRKWLKLLCLFLTLVLMAFAKRDGVVVAVIMSGLFLVEIRNTWIQFILIAGGVVISLIIGSVAQMAGQSVLSHLINVLGNIQFKYDEFWEFYVVFISFSTILLISKRYIYFFVGLSFALFIVLSINLMLQSGQFSSGTIDRKIYYMYIPFLISTLLLFSSQFQVGVLVLVAAIAFGDIFNETWQAKRRVEGLKLWSDTFRSEIHTLRKLVPNYRDVSLGLLHPREHMRFVNGPLNTATLFNQPFLQAFFGADLALSNQPLELLDREVLIIDRSFSAESLTPLAEAGFHFYTHLGGYKVAARDPKFSPTSASLPGLLALKLKVVDSLEEPQVVLGNSRSEWNLQRWDDARLVSYIRYGDTKGADLTIRQSDICENLAVAFRFDNRNDPSNPVEARVFLDGNPLSTKSEKSGSLMTFYWGDALLDALQVRDATTSQEAKLELRFGGLEPGSMLSILNPSLVVITETKDFIISDKLRCR